MYDIIMRDNDACFANTLKYRKNCTVLCMLQRFAVKILGKTIHT